MTETQPLLETEIRSLLDLPAERLPPREVVEHTLTSGYALALRLDAQRLRTEQRLRALLRSGEGGPAGHDDLAQELTALDGELERLRALLASFRRQAL